MIKLTYSFFMSSNKQKIFMIFFFYNLFFICIKISNDSSAKYYKDNKERLQKARERYQSLSKGEQE